LHSSSISTEIKNQSYSLLARTTEKGNLELKNSTIVKSRMKTSRRFKLLENNQNKSRKKQSEFESYEAVDDLTLELSLVQDAFPISVSKLKSFFD